MLIYLKLDYNNLGKSTDPIASFSMTPLLPQNQLRVTLTWPDSPSDIDLFSFFRTSKNRVCSIFFGEKLCNEVYLNTDNYNNRGDRKGAETITIELQENFIYTFAARKYVDQSDNGHLKDEKRVKDAPKIPYFQPKIYPDVNMDKSKARISLYAPGFSQKLFEFLVPDNIDSDNILYPKTEEGFIEKDFNWWLAFCMDGSQGIESIKIVNKLSVKEPGYEYCESLYNRNEEENVDSVKKPTAFIEFEVDDDYRIRKINQNKIGNGIRRN